MENLVKLKNGSMKFKFIGEEVTVTVKGGESEIDFVLSEKEAESLADLFSDILTEMETDRYCRTKGNLK